MSDEKEIVFGEEYTSSDLNKLGIYSTGKSIEVPIKARLPRIIQRTKNGDCYYFHDGFIFYLNGSDFEKKECDIEQTIQATPEDKHVLYHNGKSFFIVAEESDRRRIDCHYYGPKSLIMDACINRKKFDTKASELGYWSIRLPDDAPDNTIRNYAKKMGVKAVISKDKDFRDFELALYLKEADKATEITNAFEQIEKRSYYF